MPPRKAPRTRTTPATTTNTTYVTNAQLQAMIDQGVTFGGLHCAALMQTGMTRWTAILRESVFEFVELTHGLNGYETVFRVKHSLCGGLLVMMLVCNDLDRTAKKMIGKVQPRFPELYIAVCSNVFPEESDKVEKYVGGLPDMIHGSVMATRSKTMQDAIKFATELMDKKISTLAERQAENKRKLDNNNQTQQQLSKRQNVAQAYAAGTGERKEYAGTLPLCNKCKFHHNGPCTVKCANCKRVGHLTRDCWSSAATNNQRTLTCYECGNQGHYRSDCPELKNRNHGNQAEGTEARGMVGPFKVLEQVESVAYKLKLPQELSRVHNTFHVSNLKKCYSDDPLVVPLEGLQVDDKLHFVEEPVEIMDREVKQLRRSRVPIVKVRWNSRRGPEFTWEREDQFRKKYPHLFTKTAPSSSAVS
ncbi:putative reverse transcriptase domain-containing protein [Tanacetum coccineum]